jgi:acyl carrier protein
MGWKASCILINERGPGYLGTMPPHDPQRARRLIADLGLGPCRSRGMTTFEEGIYPDHLVVGAYDGAAVIGDPQIINACLSLSGDPLIDRVLLLFPQAAVLRVGLHSVVNLWSYAYFEGGKLLRAYGGSADMGVVVDEGEWLPEERPHFERSVVRDGQRYFCTEIYGEEVEFDASAYGETLALEVMGRFFGCRPDQGHPQIDPLGLTMESFERERPRWWRRPLKMMYFVMEGYRGKPKSPVCLICGEKPGGIGLTPDALCPACGRLLGWFRGYYASEPLDLGTITAETKFTDFLADSLDYVEWLVEAEEHFGVVIPDRDAERMTTVGDFLGYIRLCQGAAKPPGGWSPRSSGSSDPMWDRQVDA